MRSFTSRHKILAFPSGLEVLSSHRPTYICLFSGDLQRVRITQVLLDTFIFAFTYFRLLADAKRQLLRTDSANMSSMPRMGLFRPPPSQHSLRDSPQVNQGASESRPSGTMTGTSAMEDGRLPGVFSLYKGQLSLLRSRTVPKRPTAGFIADARRPGRPLQFSMSRPTDEHVASERVLDNAKASPFFAPSRRFVLPITDMTVNQYTKLVRTICSKMLNYPLPEFKHGNRKHEGQFVAGHAENKLAVWLLRQLLIKHFQTGQPETCTVDLVHVLT